MLLITPTDSARLRTATARTPRTSLVATLEALERDAKDAEPPPLVHLPSRHGLELDTVMLPRDAFFGPVEQVPIKDAEGRVAAEMVSPYPPGVLVLAHGELITRESLDYLSSGVAAGGMLIPDGADSELKTPHVVSR